MGMTELSTFLQNGGPWALTAILLFAYAKKDRQIAALHAERRADDRKTIEAVTLLSTAVTGLKDTLMTFLNRSE